jgi:hypothetical protein
MLISKGTHVAFGMSSGRLLRASGSMLHDPIGAAWPKDSLLVATFRHGKRLASDEEKAGAPKHYLGREYAAHIGTIDLPPRSIGEWKRIGEVETLYYERPGIRAPGRYYHHFGRRRLEAFFKKGKAILYKRGSAYRLEMGKGSVATDLGIIFP